MVKCCILQGMNGMVNWLSNKLNLVVMILVCYSMILYMLWDKLTSNQLIIICILLSLLSFLHRLLGVARGILICAIDKKYYEYMKTITEKENTIND